MISATRNIRPTSTGSSNTRFKKDVKVDNSIKDSYRQNMPHEVQNSGKTAEYQKVFNESNKISQSNEINSGQVKQYGKSDEYRKNFCVKSEANMAVLMNKFPELFSRPLNFEAMKQRDWGYNKHDQNHEGSLYLKQTNMTKNEEFRSGITITSRPKLLLADYKNEMNSPIHTLYRIDGVIKAVYLPNQGTETDPEISNKIDFFPDNSEIEKYPLGDERDNFISGSIEEKLRAKYGDRLTIEKFEQNNRPVKSDLLQGKLYTEQDYQAGKTDVTLISDEKMLAEFKEVNRLINVAYRIDQLRHKSTS